QADRAREHRGERRPRGQAGPRRAMSHVSESGHSILDEIVERQRAVVSRARAERSIDELRAAPLYAPPRRSLESALRGGAPAVIAECKRRSPSRGLLCAAYDPQAIASSYARSGAAAVSVLTNEEFFGGTLADLSAVRCVVDIPVLRKDFIIDDYQLEEARAAGADAVLLIARVLVAAELARLLAAAAEIGLECLVEVHDEHEMQAASDARARIIGINNRDLSSFTTDLALSERLASRAPAGVVLVAESGLKHGGDLARLRRC